MPYKILFVDHAGDQIDVPGGVEPTQSIDDPSYIPAVGDTVCFFNGPTMFTPGDRCGPVKRRTFTYGPGDARTVTIEVDLST